MKTLIILLSTFYVINSATFPPSFKKCNRKTEDFNLCTTIAAEDGLHQLEKALPHLNLPSLEPLEVKELNIDPGTRRIVDVTQKFSNCKIYGPSKATVNELKFDFDQKVISTNLTIPKIELQCQYKLDGRVLLLPIAGSGNCTIDLTELKIISNFTWEEHKKEKKHFLKVVSNNLSLDPKLLHFNFKNLFNGQKGLGDNINNALNEGWVEVFEDIKPGYNSAFGIIFQDLFNRFFSKLSIEDAFD